MELEDLLIMQLVLTLVFSIGALATSSFVIFRIFKRERQRLDETEKHAFELYDAIFQSFIPRTLSDKLSNIYKTEVDAHAMNDKPILPSTKQVNPNQNAQQQPSSTAQAQSAATGSATAAAAAQTPQLTPTPAAPVIPTAAATGISATPETPQPTPAPAATPAPEIPAAPAAPPQPPAPAVAQAPVLPP